MVPGSKKRMKVVAVATITTVTAVTIITVIAVAKAKSNPECSNASEWCGGSRPAHAITSSTTPAIMIWVAVPHAAKPIVTGGYFTISRRQFTGKAPRVANFIVIDLWSCTFRVGLTPLTCPPPSNWFIAVAGLAKSDPIATALPGQYHLFEEPYHQHLIRWQITGCIHWPGCAWPTRSWW